MDRRASLRQRLLVYLTLVANGIWFFHRPLFKSAYSFPWDFRAVQLPLISFLAEELQRGRMALWDPFTYCGDPIFANIQASFFHPLIFAAAFLSSQTSLDALPMFLEWVVVLQVCFAAAISFHVFRQFDLRPAACWTGAVIFETGGYFASRTEHIGTVMAVAWMPLALLAVLKLESPFRARWLGILGLALGMSVLGGFPQATLAVFIAAVLLSVLLALLRMRRVRIIGDTLLGVILGIGTAAVIFVPTSQLTPYSVAQYRTGWLGTGGGLYWQSFASLVWPNAYHIFDLAKFQGLWDPSFLYLYGSLAGLGLAVYALARVRTRAVALFGILGGFGAILMLGDKTFLWNALYPLLPEAVRIGIHPEYTYCIFTFAMAGLAALGLHPLLVRDAARWAIGVLVVIDLYVAGANRPMNCTFLPQDPGVTRHSFGGSELLLSEMRRYSNLDFPPARIDSVDTDIQWVEGAMLTRVSTASGASPLALSNIIQARLLLHQGSPWGWYYPVAHADSPILDVMNVKYLLASPKAAPKLRADAKFEHRASLPATEVYANRSVLPRCFVVNKVRRVRSSKEARDLIESGRVDLHSTALVYDAAELSGSSAVASTRASITHYEPTRVEIAVTGDSASFLVLSDADYPGWKASLDGQPLPIHLTDIAFRGMIVPPGAHRIEMRFRPTILVVGAVISACFVGLEMLLVLWGPRLLAKQTM